MYKMRKFFVKFRANTVADIHHKFFYDIVFIGALCIAVTRGQ